MVSSVKQSDTHHIAKGRKDLKLSLVETFHFEDLAFLCTIFQGVNFQ